LWLMAGNPLVLYQEKLLPHGGSDNTIQI